jgi:predicted metal-binding membrane protein
MAGSAVADDTVLEAALRRDRWIVAASLAAVTVLAWIYLVVLAKAMASMANPSGWRAFMGLMPMGRWGLLEYALGFAMWDLMMVGMMVPSAAPMIMLYARVARGAHSQSTPLVATTAFAAGYLLMWGAFSLIAATVQGVLVDMALMTETMTSASRVLAGAVFIAAGLYQWMPLKRACLAHCRSPFWFLSRHWRPGTPGALRMGIEHGAYCVGCCWALMTVLFAVGIMNLAWVAAIAAFVLVEKTAPFGAWSQRVAGVLLVALGVLTLAGSVAS